MRRQGRPLVFVRRRHGDYAGRLKPGREGRRLASLDGEFLRSERQVAADFTLNGFGLVVQRGQITRIKTGKIEGSGSVGFKDLKLDKPFGKIELLDEIPLDDGYPSR